MKQTVEEAAQSMAYNKMPDWGGLPALAKKYFIKGADWQARQSPWISVEERLPENNTVVLTRGAYGFLICQLSSLGEWETGANVNKERLGITHWMPIPSFDKILEVNKDYWNELKRKEIKYEKDCTVRRI